MTSTNVNPVNQVVAAFKELQVDDQLVALGLIYTEVSGSISATTLKLAESSVAQNLVKQIEQMPQQEQLLALRDILVSSGSSPLTLEYQTLDTTSRLAMWYQMAQEMGEAIAAIPKEHTVSAEVAEFLTSLKSMDFEHLISFLSSVV